MITPEARVEFTQQIRARRRGRPKSLTPIVVTSVKLPEPLFDALCQRAMRERRSLHSLIKDALRLYVPN